jgi:hypothetical protein
MPKELALHDRIDVDGSDVSNLVRSVETESENEEVDVSGFSVSGNRETLPGERVQAITFEMFAGEELHALLWPIHRDRDVVPIEWQPHGLIEATRETLVGNAVLLTYPPGAERGTPRTVSVRFTPGDENGFDWLAAS